MDKKVEQLEQMLGCKTTEAEIIWGALKLAQAKKLISMMPSLSSGDTLSFE